MLGLLIGEKQMRCHSLFKNGIAYQTLGMQSNCKPFYHLSCFQMELLWSQPWAHANQRTHCLLSPGFNSQLQTDQMNLEKSFNSISSPQRQASDLHNDRQMPNPNAVLWKCQEGKKYVFMEWNQGYVSVKCWNKQEFCWTLKNWQVLFQDNFSSYIRCSGVVFYRNGWKNMEQKLRVSNKGRWDPSSKTHCAKEACWVTLGQSHTVILTYLTELFWG